jgi:hypothetical protein
MKSTTTPTGATAGGTRRRRMRNTKTESSANSPTTIQRATRIEGPNSL